jgi:hypothetical protein
MFACIVVIVSAYPMDIVIVRILENIFYILLQS